MYNVAIIGAGSIGALKDKKYDGPATAHSLTHAHAIYKSNNFKLSIIIDKDIEKAKKAAKRWGCKYSDNIEDLEKHFINVAIVAVDTKYHSKIIIDILAVCKDYLKIIICEKPFCKNINDAISIKEECKRRGVKLIINYSRRYCKSFQEIKSFLNKKKVFETYIKYNRGIKRDGCHAIDLINWFFGNYDDVKLLPDKPLKDNWRDSLTYNFITSHKDCKRVYFVGHDFRNHSIFEIDIFYAGGRIIISNNGSKVIWIQNIDDPVYGDKHKPYWSFNKYSNVKIMKTDLMKMLDNLYMICKDILDGKKQEYCTPEDAIQVHKITDIVEEKYDETKKPIQISNKWWRKIKEKIFSKSAR